MFLSALLSQFSLKQHKTGIVPTLLHWPQIKATFFFCSRMYFSLNIKPLVWNLQTKSYSTRFHWSLDTEETQKQPKLSCLLIHPKTEKLQVWILYHPLKSLTLQLYSERLPKRKPERNVFEWEGAGKLNQNCLYFLLSTSTFPEILFQFQIWGKTTPQIM